MFGLGAPVIIVMLLLAGGLIAVVVTVVKLSARRSAPQGYGSPSQYGSGQPYGAPQPQSAPPLQVSPLPGLSAGLSAQLSTLQPAIDPSSYSAIQNALANHRSLANILSGASVVSPQDKTAIFTAAGDCLQRMVERYGTMAGAQPAVRQILGAEVSRLAYDFENATKSAALLVTGQQVISAGEIVQQFEPGN